MIQDSLGGLLRFLSTLLSTILMTVRHHGQHEAQRLPRDPLKSLWRELADVATAGR
jgi:hypothetical protein